MESPVSVPQKTSPKDFFLHLLSIITLYASAVAFTTLLFQYANYFFPDPLVEGRYLMNSIAGSIRWSVAALIVVFPVYILVSRFLNKSYAITPYLRTLRIRRWLIYFTVFATALIMIGDLVSLIYALLGGRDITMRFFIKVLALLFVTGSIFLYYLTDIRENKKFPIKIFAQAIIGIVAIGIIGAFFIVGSPTQARLVIADDRRINDLSQIQWQIVNYWQGKEILPAKLEDLRDSISGYIPPVDPETNAPYEYTVNGESSFTLCATFALPSERMSGRSAAYQTKPIPPIIGGEPIQETWDHGEGHVCFNRSIDPELYPPFPKR